MPSTRRFAVIAAMLVAVTTTTGCGPSRSGEDSSPEEQAPSAPTTTLAPIALGKYVGVEDNFCEELALADVLEAHRVTTDPDRWPGSVSSEPGQMLAERRLVGTDTIAQCDLSGDHLDTSIQGGLVVSIYADPARAGRRYDNSWEDPRAFEVEHLNGWWERAVHTEIWNTTGQFVVMYHVHDDNLYLRIDLAADRQAEYIDAWELFHDIATDVLDHAVTHLPLRER
jgi:hypothetical protein